MALLAFNEEFQSLIENKSWELGPRPEVPTNSTLLAINGSGSTNPGIVRYSMLQKKLTGGVYKVPLINRPIH